MTKLAYPIVLSSYKLFEYCTTRYTKRRVMSDRYVGMDDFYYWSRTGKLRLVRNKKEIWVLGKEYPEIVRVK